MEAIKSYTTIKRFIPDEKKLEFLANKLLSEKLYLTDEFRSRQAVFQLLTYYMYASRSFTLEFEKFGGILWFVEIIPEYKADVIFKMWDKSIYGPTFARELKAAFNDFMRMFKLKRLQVATPCERGAALAKKMGFKIEGRQKYGFRWNGQLYTNILLRKTRD